MMSWSRQLRRQMVEAAIARSLAPATLETPRVLEAFHSASQNYNKDKKKESNFSAVSHPVSNRISLTPSSDSPIQRTKSQPRTLENAHLLLTQHHLLPNRLLEPKLALHLHSTLSSGDRSSARRLRLRPSLFLGRLRNSVLSVLGISILLLTVTLGTGTPLPRSRRSRRSPSGSSGSFSLRSPGLRRRVVVVGVAGLESGGESAVSISFEKGESVCEGFLFFLSMGRLRFEIRMDVNGWGTQGIRARLTRPSVCSW